MLYAATVSLSTMAENPIDYRTNSPTTMMRAEEADPITATTPTAATIGTNAFVSP